MKDDFGAANGTPITNKTTILSDIDTITSGKKPSIEYFYVYPFTSRRIFLFNWAMNFYGHAALRYTLDGEDVFVNITGFPDEEMVHFLTTEEYLFGTENFDVSAEQGGVYNRTYVSVRIEDYDEEKIRDMDYYFRKIKRRNIAKESKFSIIFSPFWNLFKDLMPFSIAERGNCARWISAGLVEGGLLKKRSLFPKRIWVNLFEEKGTEDPDNVNVVMYKKVEHAQHSYGELQEPRISGIGPLMPLGNYLYLDLEKYADLSVSVPKGSMTAQISTNEHVKKPNWYRYNRWPIFGAVVLTVMFFYPIKKNILKIKKFKN